MTDKKPVTEVVAQESVAKAEEASASFTETLEGAYATASVRPSR